MPADLPKTDAEDDETLGFSFVLGIPRSEIASVAVAFRSLGIDKLPRLTRLERGGDDAFDGGVRIKRRDGAWGRWVNFAAGLQGGDEVLSHGWDGQRNKQEDEDS